MAAPTRTEFANGSTIEIDAGSDRANERRAGAGLFFGGNFGRIELGR
jgi:hypothetical protein